MLDQLRAMGVFACVVERSSFSGAARDLGITTSAVSQQIRSLEHEMEVTLLHRSTRKLSLTEAGQAFFQSCQEMLAAAERGKVRINELRDDLVGDLRISSSPEIAAQFITPALSTWLMTHRGLNLQLVGDHHNSDLISGRIDIALRLSDKIDEHHLEVIPLTTVDQVLVAAPRYLNQSNPIVRPEDLIHHELITLSTATHSKKLVFQHTQRNEEVDVQMRSRVETNDIQVAKSFSQLGHGLARFFYLDVQKELLKGDLLEVMPDWKLPSFTLYAVMPKQEQHATKVLRCLDVLTQYFQQLPLLRPSSELQLGQGGS